MPEYQQNHPPRSQTHEHTAERPPAPADVERQFLDAERRAHRYWYEDGLAEIAVGAAFIVLALYFLAQALALGRVGPAASLAITLLFPALVFAACFGVRRLLGRVKERLVYPRAGFAAFPRDRRMPRWVAGMLAGGIAALIAVFARSSPVLDAWLPALQGLVVALFLAALGRFSGLSRFRALALFAAFAGVAVSMLRASSGVSAALFFGALGLVLAGSGWLAFRRFMQPAGGMDER